MEIKDMNLEEVIARMNAISEELNGEGADIEALETETNALIEGKASLIAQKKADVKAVIEDQGHSVFVALNKLGGSQAQGQVDLIGGSAADLL